MLTALALASCPSADAQPQAPIVINVENSAGPYSRGENGKPVGLAYELVAAVFSEAKINVEYRLMPYARCMAQTKRGNGAGCITTAKNKENLADFAWHSKPFVQQKMAIVVRAEFGEGSLKLNDLYGHKVIAVNGYTYADDYYIAKPHLKLENAVNDVVALQMLKKKRADYAILEERIMAFNMATEPVLKALGGKFRVAGYLNPLDGYVSFSKTEPGLEKLITAFDEAQARLERSGALAAILKRHDF
ncbi:transporter substrate-binding domain-containing protein [Paucibacter sp. AS339]|uniref:substrate-binding periplasmic protein n=1 Tax=Paucibacter hankyongi TaxID=3133434 RepID=UPI0030B28E84